MDQDVLDGLLALLIDMLLVVGNEGLGESLPDGVDLGDATTSLNADSDVDIGKTVLAQEQDWLLKLVLECLWLNLFKWFSIDVQDSLSRACSKRRR